MISLILMLVNCLIGTFGYLPFVKNFEFLFGAIISEFILEIVICAIIATFTIDKGE